MSPFMGVGSEVWESVRSGRFGIGVELKASYYRQAIRNLQSLSDPSDQDDLLAALEVV